MESSHIATVIFIGNTGTGKSAVCNYFREKLKSPQDIHSPFEESKKACSTIMVSPVAQSYDQIKIVDTPGLSDSGGAKNDLVNLSKISEFTQELKFVHSFTFVLNEQNPRFDESTQATFCLFYTRFGDQFLKYVNFIFTRANSMKCGKEQTQEKVKEFTEILSKRLQIPIENFPQFECFQFECHPDDCEGTSDDYKQRLVQRTAAEYQLFKKKVLEIQPLETTKIVESPDVINNAQIDADSQQKAEEHQMKIQEELKTKESEQQKLLQSQKEEQALFEEKQKYSMLTQNMRIEFSKELKEFEEKMKNIKDEIESLKRQSAKAKEQLEKENEKVNKWWWLLALPVPVGAGIAAGTATTSVALSSAALTASATAVITTTTSGTIYAAVLTALGSIGITGLGTTTSAVAVVSAVPMATIGVGVAVGVGVAAVSTGLIIGGIRYLSMKDEKALIN